MQVDDPASKMGLGLLRMRQALHIQKMPFLAAASALCHERPFETCEQTHTWGTRATTYTHVSNVLDLASPGMMETL